MDKIEIKKIMKKILNDLIRNKKEVFFISYLEENKYLAVLLPTINDITFNIGSEGYTLCNEQYEVNEIYLNQFIKVLLDVRFLKTIISKDDLYFVNPRYKFYFEYLYNTLNNNSYYKVKEVVEDLIAKIKYIFPDFTDINKECLYDKEIGTKIIEYNSIINNFLNKDKLYDILYDMDDDTQLIYQKIKDEAINYKKAKSYIDMYCEKSLDDYNQVLFSLAIDKKIDEDRDKKIDEDLNYNFKCLLMNYLDRQINPNKNIVNITKYDNIYLTSDLHFGHKNIIKYENRDEILNINTVEEHDNRLIENWNSEVKKNDLVFILGDFSFYKAEETNSILEKLNGDKILIIGNHDQTFLNKIRFDKSLFKEICYYKEFEYKGYNICLMHYPIKSFNGMLRENSIHFCGHIHSTNEELSRHTYNVGVDVNNYKPIEINEAIQKALLNENGITNSKE